MPQDIWAVMRKAAALVLLALFPLSSVAHALDQLPSAIDPTATPLDDAIALAADVTVDRLLSNPKDAWDKQPVCLVFDANHRARYVDFSAPDPRAQTESHDPDFGAGIGSKYSFSDAPDAPPPPPPPPIAAADISFSNAVAEVLRAQHTDPQVKFAPDCAAHSRHVVVSPPEPLTDQHCTNARECELSCQKYDCETIFRTGAGSSVVNPRFYRIDITVHTPWVQKSSVAEAAVTDGRLLEVRRVAVEFVWHLD